MHAGLFPPPVLAPGAPESARARTPEHSGVTSRRTLGCGVWEKLYSARRAEDGPLADSRGGYGDGVNRGPEIHPSVLHGSDTAPSNRVALLTAFHRPPNPQPLAGLRGAVAPTCQQRAVPPPGPRLSCSPAFLCSRAEQAELLGATRSLSSRHLVQVNNLFCANYCHPREAPHLGCLFCCGFWPFLPTA